MNVDITKGWKTMYNLSNPELETKKLSIYIEQY